MKYMLNKNKFFFALFISFINLIPTNSLNTLDKNNNDLSISNNSQNKILMEKKQSELVNIDSKNILNINFSSKLKEAENNLYDNLLSSMGEVKFIFKF